MGELIDLTEEFEHRREINDITRSYNARIAWKLAMFNQEFIEECKRVERMIKGRKDNE